jgi:hypothetical protein
LVLAALAAAAWLGLRLAPLPGALFEPPPPGLALVDRHGLNLRQVPQQTNRFARPVSFGAIPAVFIQATLAAEDKRFWQHHGVDWLASARAALDLVRYRRIVSAGSTITQQLIKLAQPRPRSLRAKLIEAAQAARLEQVWGKQHILAEYLNRVDYGNLCCGCAEASGFYFGKPLGELSVAEAAFLAGLPQAPSRLNPGRHFARARPRQQWILGRMRVLGWLSEAACQRAAAEPLRLNRARRAFQAPHFVDLLLRQEGEAAFAGQRGPIQTTLDRELNRLAESILRGQLARLRSQRVHDGAAVALENRTGDVLALVGSPHYFDAQSGQVNGAWAPSPAARPTRQSDGLTADNADEADDGPHRAAAPAASPAVLERFLGQALPPPESPSDYDAAGRVRLAAEYRQWAASADNWLAGQVVVEEAPTPAPLRLLSPLPGTTYFLDPDLPDSSRWLPLKAQAPPGSVWESDSLECRRYGTGVCARLVAGRHRLRVRSPATGEQAETWILVKRRQGLAKAQSRRGISGLPVLQGFLGGR